MTHDSSEVLFRTASGFSEGNYLGFLSQRVPKDIAEQLSIDGQPDLGASKSVSVADLVRPLSARAFPSGELWEQANILEYITICYRLELDKNPARHDLYKVIYVASLYLYCYVRAGGPGVGPYLMALGILAEYSLQADLDVRLQVCGFIRFLIPMIYEEISGPASVTIALSYEYAPLSSALIALSLIVASIASDLSTIVSDTMKNEHIDEAWSARNKREQDPGYDHGVRVLKGLVSEMYGAPGKVQEVADRFLLALEEKKGSKEE